jgi:DNA polymerase (family 10)
MAATVYNEELSRIFAEMGEMLEILGENTFRVRAYENLSRIFASLDHDAKELFESGELEKIKGVGESTVEKVKEFLQTGTIKAHQELKAKLPEGLLDLLKIPGFGPKKAKMVWEKLGITSLHELEEAARSGRLEEVAGFGKKTEENILAGIELVKKHKGQFLWSDAMHVIEPALKALSADRHTRKIEVGGSIRRFKETVKDGDILIASDSPAETAKVFVKAIEPERVTSEGETKVSVVTKAGMAVDLRMVTEENFPYALHHFTGSKEHNIAMRGRSQKLGFKMNEYGLFKEGKGGKETLVPCKSEEDIFKVLGLAYIPPELRENMGEIEAAEKNTLPLLIEKTDLKGAIHVHSEYSDGHNTIEEMAQAAKELGYSYMLLTDHSQSARYAGGLIPDDLNKQWAEIDKLNEKLKGITILKGTECDILADGTMDYDDKMLASFDCVIGSIHAGFTYDEKQQTERIISAARNRYVDVIGHPTGRLLLQREGYRVDLEKILKACADTGTAVEINGNPNRLDLDWRWVRRAKEMGVKFVLTSDSHMKDTLTHQNAAVGIARKGWLERDDVLNTLSVKKFLASLKRSQ